MRFFRDKPKTMLNAKNAKPLEFRVDLYGWDCKLAFKGDREEGKYLFWINEVLAKALPKAPPISKDNIAPVCQSDNLVILNYNLKRVTFQLFIFGLLHQIIAEHNCRSKCTFLEVDGKIIKQWDGVSLEQIE